MTAAIPLWRPALWFPQLASFTAGKFQRNPDTGKRQRNPDTGKLIRNTDTNTNCCCAGGIVCGASPTSTVRVTIADWPRVACSSFDSITPGSDDLNGAWDVPFSTTDGAGNCVWNQTFDVNIQTRTWQNSNCTGSHADTDIWVTFEINVVLDIHTDELSLTAMLFLSGSSTPYYVIVETVPYTSGVASFTNSGGYAQTHHHGEAGSATAEAL